MTDALAILARDRALVGYEFQGRRHDIGDRLGLVTANLTYALEREDLAEGLKAYLRTLLDE